MAKSTRLDRANWSRAQEASGVPVASTPGNIYINMANGDLYSRDSGDTWHKVTSGGGGGDDTLDTCYNNDSFTRTVTVDDGDILFDINGDYDFTVDLQGVSQSSNKGFKVEDGSDYFRVMKSTASLYCSVEVYSFLVSSSNTLAIGCTSAASLTAGGSSDLTLGARGQTVTLNESGEESLDGDFSATSIIGALNEVKTGLSLDDAYNNDSGERTVTIDDGNIGWYVSGNNWFNVDVTLADSNVGFIVANNADYFQLTREGTSVMDWEAALRGTSVTCSTTVALSAGASSDMTLGARGQTVTLNESGEESLDVGFTATSLIGALNELKGAGITPTLDDCYDNDSGTRTITVDDGDVYWDIQDANDFRIDLTNVTHQSGAGFFIEDGSEYVKCYKKPPASMDFVCSVYGLDLHSTNIAYFKSDVGVTIQAGTSSDITFTARTASVYLNETGDTDWDGAFTADSIVGCVNELMTDKVKGPASATDNKACRFDSTTGKLIQDSLVGIDDLGHVSCTLINLSHSYGDDTAIVNMLNSGGNAGEAAIFVGGRDPEGYVGVSEGNIYIREDSTDYESAIYQKIAGSGTTGWRRLAMAPDPSGLSDDTCSGDVIFDYVDANAFGQWAALHMDTDGNWIEADADAAATMPCMALAVESGTGSSKPVLLRGFVKNNAWDWDEGDPVYVSTTSGDLTQTAPAGSGDQVQIVGWARTPDILYFCPDNTVEAIP